MPNRNRTGCCDISGRDVGSGLVHVGHKCERVVGLQNLDGGPERCCGFCKLDPKRSAAGIGVGCPIGGGAKVEKYLSGR